MQCLLGKKLYGKIIGQKVRVCLGPGHPLSLIAGTVGVKWQRVIRVNRGRVYGYLHLYIVFSFPSPNIFVLYSHSVGAWAYGRRVREHFYKT